MPPSPLSFYSTLPMALISFIKIWHIWELWMTACLTPQGETNPINRLSIKLPLNYEYHTPSALHFFLGCPIIHSHLPNLQSCLSLQYVQQVRVLTSTTPHIFTESCRIYLLNTLYDMTFPGPIGIALVNCYSPRLLSLLLNRGFSPSGFSRRHLWPLLRQQSPHCIHQLMHLHCPQKNKFLAGTEYVLFKVGSLVPGIW